MSQLFAKYYDLFMGPLEKRRFYQIRRELISNASGNVLELGSGTGINFPFYKDVEKVTAIEPSPFMIDRSLCNQQNAVVPIEVVQASAEQLPFPDNSFDTIVATLVFCTIPDAEKAIHEIKRVCKPEGKILLFEHIKMKNRFLSTLQDWLTPAWKKICDGCCLNRDTLNLLKSHQIQIGELHFYYKDLFFSAQTVNKKG